MWYSLLWLIRNRVVTSGANEESGVRSANESKVVSEAVFLFPSDLSLVFLYELEAYVQS